MILNSFTKAGITGWHHRPGSQVCSGLWNCAGVQKAGIREKPEVMVPLVGFKKELDLQVAVAHAAAKAVMAEQKVKLNYRVGTCGMAVPPSP